MRKAVSEQERADQVSADRLQVAAKEVNAAASMARSRGLMVELGLFVEPVSMGHGGYSSELLQVQMARPIQGEVPSE